MSTTDEDAQTHRGPVTVRFNDKQNRYTVLCPMGHLVTGGETGPGSGFAGSYIEAKIGAHQHGSRPWIVACDGAVVPPIGAVSA